MENSVESFELKNATSYILLFKKGQLEQTMADLRAQYEALGSKIQEVYAQTSAIDEELDSRRLRDTSTEEDWPFLLEESGNASKARLDAVRKALARLTTDGQEVALTVSGYFVDIGQRALKLSLYKGNAQLTQKVKVALELLMPHLKPLESDGEVYRKVSLLESGLSASGSLWLAIQPEDGLFEVRKTTYGITRKVFSTDSLEKLLNFAEDKCYYERWDQAASRVPR